MREAIRALRPPVMRRIPPQDATALHQVALVAQLAPGIARHRPGSAHTHTRRGLDPEAGDAAADGRIGRARGAVDRTVDWPLSRSALLPPALDPVARQPV